MSELCEVLRDKNDTYIRQGKHLIIQLITQLSLCIFSWMIGLSAQICQGWAQDSSRRVAVLDFKNSAELTSFEINSLTSIVRGSASRLSGYSVMTQENIAVMLPPGKRVEDCIGTCEVETGKLLGAGFIITGEIGRIEGQLQLSMRLFDTERGSLLGQEVVVGADVIKLQTQLGVSSQQLLSKLSVASADNSIESGSVVLVKVKPTDTTLSLNGGPLYLGDFPKKGDGHLVRLKAGKYTLRGEASGYLSQEESFILSEGALIEVTLQLNRELKRDTSCDPADPQCRGELLVYTRPAGAQLWVDGRQTAYITKPSRRDPTEGTLSLSLPPGEHVIEARLAKHLPAKERVSLKRDDINQSLQKKPLTLTPNFGDMKIESEPSGATVFLDDKMVGVTPWRGEKIEAGPHKLRLFKEDYRSLNEVVMVTRASLERQRFTLEPTFAELSVVVRSEGAPVEFVSVMLDQRLMGHTNSKGELTLGRQPEGQRQLQLLHPLYAPLIQSVELKAGAQRTERLTLEPAYATLQVSVKDGVSASVELDGELIGRAPLTQLVPSGNSLLTVIPDDESRYATFKKRLALGVKERLEVKADCQARLGSLMVITDPPEADVVIDGAQRGVSPLKLELFDGTHKVMVSLPGYAALSETVEVEEGELKKLRLELPQDPQVVLTCLPGGDVSVEGVRLGASPQTITRKPGRYQLTCEYSGLKESREVVFSDRREELTLRIIPKRLKEQEALRSSKKLRLWSAVGASALLGGLAWYEGRYRLNTLMNERDEALARLDAQSAWTSDEEAQSVSARSLVWLSLSSVSALWALYEWRSMPPAVRLSSDVSSQVLRPVVSPFGLGLMGSF